MWGAEPTGMWYHSLSARTFDKCWRVAGMQRSTHASAMLLSGVVCVHMRVTRVCAQHAFGSSARCRLVGEGPLDC